MDFHDLNNRTFLLILEVIVNLNHENPSRIAEVRRTLVPTKSILDHTKLQSRFAKKMPENSIISGLKYV